MMRTSLWRLGIVAATIVYAALKLYGVAQPNEFVGALIFEALAYVLAIVAVFGLACFAFEQLWIWLTAATAGALTAAIVIGGAEHLTMALLDVAAVALTGSLIGVLVRRGVRPIRVYIGSIIVSAVLVLATLLPNWPELHEAALKSKDLMIQDFESTLTVSGYSAQDQETLRDSLQRAVTTLVRLIPATSVLSGMVQVSVGFLWFASRIRRLYNRATVDQYTLWKVPFGVLPLVILFAAMRLLGSESLQLIADNGLMVLAIFYCLAGLALVEYMIRRLNVGCFMKGLFYLMLVLTQIFGLLLLSLLGFVDSFADWRKIAAAKIALKS